MGRDGIANVTPAGSGCKRLPADLCREAETECQVATIAIAFGNDHSPTSRPHGTR
jgi:hypothetical protein